METIDQLRIVIQVSISLAGFSGIVASFQYRGRKIITRGDTLGLVMLVNASLADAFFSFLPIALFNFITAESTVWCISSGLIAVNYIGFFCYSWARLKFVKLRKTVTKIIHYLWLASMVVMAVLNILNSLGIVFHHEYSVYFVSLLWPLIGSGYLFARLVSRPLWGAIRLQEKKDDPKLKY